MDKREKFKDLATKRVNEILKKMRVLSNLSNKYNYDYTDEDVYNIFKTLRNALNQSELIFKSKKNNEFKL